MIQMLDRNKKYEGLGLTWSFSHALYEWIGANVIGEVVAREIGETVIQSWLDAGYIKPVQETKIVRVEGVQVKRQNFDLCVIGWMAPVDWDSIPAGAIAKPFTVEFEVPA